ncbi:M56 family metallopeptidase [Tuwongella immobilis]|uniref:PDZ domain-containing protein n=1 Tax=Tuwongella immobilis TaxID=692036 RepID=A0A6C2YR02_9BACT|nr:M56 family metallopeptidase [Tuwongella immobilis]VIP04080.1 peptidase m56 1 : Peptidase M56 BlaR1 OS=Planctomyces brasiliensis (strain ATCC 49424 / DSM 5305 / JCM 21570 / NBRC 103401 / IFAM 1448) GN=Plabr_3892 PE=4 SV=1: Peptidase_M56: PDZ_2 [Tuwongella immobilis]VTS05527.1 peptidase m56 1 : Peptidase M56 BlaR1 OS=Planctomyces brasiliensis (strain ATCC 49424 / DSM 5305 / JCM 21570 / NBRC 103401 / IFAM 1448) GN=Plabr_3892 PE=4 SV=1: Peptidase_M56: PDZ_2 [Tuwongella immobilis]
MIDPWGLVGRWWLTSMLGGAILLGIGWWLMRRIGHPALRSMVGAWSIRATLLVAVLAMVPGWTLMTWQLPRIQREPAPWQATEGWNDATPMGLPLESRDPAARTVQWVEMIPLDGGTPSTDLTAVATTMPATGSSIDPDQSFQATATATASTATRESSAMESEPLLARILKLGLLIYAGVAAIGLARFGIALIGLQRLTWSAKSVPESVSAIWQQIIHRPAGVRILQTTRVETPICYGLFRPVILLPVSLVATADARRLKWVLAHEAGHLRRGDPWTCFWLGAAQPVFGWLPWFWSFRRELRLAQEYLADAAVTSDTVEVDEYAAFLIELSRYGVGRRARRAAPLGATGVKAVPSELSQRVQTILIGDPMKMQSLSRRWKIVAAGGFVGMALVVSGITLRAEEAKKTEETKPAVATTPAKKKEITATVVAPAATIEVTGQPTVVLGKAEIVKAAVDAQKAKIEALKLQAKQLAERAKKENAVLEEAAKTDARLKEAVEELARLRKLEADKVEALSRLNSEKLLLAMPAEGQNAIEVQVLEIDATGNVLKKVGDAKKPAAGKPAQNIQLTLVADGTGLSQEQIDQVRKAMTEAKIPAAIIEKTIQQMKAAGKGNMLYLVNPMAGQAADVEADLKRLQQEMDELRRKLVARGLAMPPMVPAMPAAPLFRALPVVPGAPVPPIAPIPPQPPIPGVGIQPGIMFQGFATTTPTPRLGINYEVPSQTLRDQLDLPENQGIVVQGVLPETAAAKIGLKTSDVLLEIGGKSVMSDAAAFSKMLSELPTDSELKVVLLRKGRKETLSGLKLPKVAKAVLQVPAVGGVEVFGLEGEKAKKVAELWKRGLEFRAEPDTAKNAAEIEKRIRTLEAEVQKQVAKELEEAARLASKAAEDAKKAAMNAKNIEQSSSEASSVSVNDKGFQLEYQRDGQKVRVSGVFSNGKPKPESVELIEGKSTKKLSGLDQLPESLRNRVESLLKGIQRSE